MYIPRPTTPRTPPNRPSTSRAQARPSLQAPKTRAEVDFPSTGQFRKQHIRIAMPKPGALPAKHQTVQQRQEQIAQYVETSQQLFNDVEKYSGRNALNIFMGPEYLYDRPTSNARHGPEDDRQLEQAEYHQTDRMNAELSKKYPDTVLKPGSVAYAMPTQRPTTLESYLASKGIYDPNDPDGEKYAQRFRANPEKFSQQNNNLFLDDAFEHLNPNHRLAKAHARYDYVNRQFPKSQLEALQGTETHLAKNKANTYFGGEKISSYSKMSNLDEVLGTPPGHSVKMTPGTHPGGLHVIDGNVFSQELCLDALTIPHQAAPDGHFTQSDYVINKHYPSDKFMASQTRFHAHASTKLQHPQTNEEIHGVFKFDQDGNRIQLKPIAEKDGVQLWDIDASQPLKTSKPSTNFESFDDLLGKPHSQQIEDIPETTPSVWKKFSSFFN